MEVCEARFGFVPNGNEPVASRVRRRYRIIKGGHVQLCLFHYSRGQAIRMFSFDLFPSVCRTDTSPWLAIPPGMLNQPVRSYPLRSLAHEASVFVVGEKAGQKIPPNAQVMLANQNREMQELERRAQRDRSASMHQVRRIFTCQTLDTEERLRGEWDRRQRSLRRREWTRKTI